MNFNIFQYIIPIYILYSFFIQRPKLNKLSILSVIILTGLITTQLNLNYREALQTFLVFLVFFVSTYWQYRDVAVSAVYSSLPLIIYYFVTLIMSYIQLPQFWMTVLVTLAYISILSWIGQKLIRWLYNKYPSSKKYVYIGVLASLFIVYYNQLMTLFDYFLLNDSLSLIFRIVYIFATVLFMLVLVLFHNSSEQIRFIEQEKAQEAISEQYNQLITKQYDEVRRFRHDYQNMLISIDGLIKEEQWVQLRAYFDQAIEKYHLHTKDTNHQLEKLVYLQNVDLRNLIYTKLVYAQSLDITVNIELKEVMYIETDNSLALPRMVGIILDNAIEEAGDIPNGELSISLIQEEREVLIIVENSCRSDIGELTQLRAEGYSTKGENRGIGLYNLDQLLQKSNILINTHIDQQVFTQELIIPREVV